jgi:hypothetical protein
MLPPFSPKPPDDREKSGRNQVLRVAMPMDTVYNPPVEVGSLGPLARRLAMCATCGCGSKKKPKEEKKKQ